MENVVLVHLAAGIGNIVLATPLLVALGRMGLTVDLWLSADYPETADLFRGWSVVRRIVDRPDRKYTVRIPAVPPFYWRAFARCHVGEPGTVARPSDALFWSDEQAYYLAFARTLGYSGPAPAIFLPMASVPRSDRAPVVLAPGCKTGEMAAKRWPHFAELAARFEDVVVVGTADDLRGFDGTAMRFPPHVRLEAGRLRLRETAALMAAAAVVVANDSGLGHVAGALGVPTILLFGPTPNRTLGSLPANVTVLRSGLPCDPCWHGRQRFASCRGAIDCMRALSPAAVEAAVAPHTRDVARAAPSAAMGG